MRLLSRRIRSFCVMSAVLLMTAALSLGCGGTVVGPDSDAVVADVATDTTPHDVTGDTVTDIPINPDVSDDVIIPAPVEHGGVTATQDLRVLVLTNGFVEVHYRLDEGTFDIDSISGPAKIRGAESRFTLADSADQWSAGIVTGTMGRAAASWNAVAVDDALGSGVDVAITFAADKTAPEFVVNLGLRGEKTFLLSHLTGTWTGDGAADIRVKRISPIALDYRTSGALFLGNDPARHVVLDNGADVYFDFQASVFRVGFRDSVFFQPGSASNWNMALVDPDSGKSIVAAYLTNERSIGLIRLHYAAAQSQELAGVHGFTDFESIGYYDPPRPLSADETDAAARTLTGELFYLDMAPQTPFDGLEDWAARFSVYNEKPVWQDIPSGWNSWGGGRSSGGYSQDIFTDRIMTNYQAMLEDFAPWGMDYFLIDDGWQKDHGDWVTNTEKFPDQEGQEFMPWLAAQVTADGLLPGLWIAPFWVKKSSDLYAAHPDWFADLNDFGMLIVEPDNNAVLDLTNPEVLQFIHDLFTKLTQEWGYRWIKMDFAYYALFNKNMYDPGVTASEAYRNAMRVIRDAIGPDTFLMGVSTIGLNMGIVDGCRLTLDNFPNWGDDEAQGMKVTLSTAAHRYYLNKAWVNHPDLLFFREEPMGLTFNEARAWASFVALYGGIVKIAEPYVDMHEHADWLHVVRSMIPVYPHTARPIDLFEMAWPEVWILPVEREGHKWHVVGLFNWGKNEDVVESAPIDEAAREKTLKWADMGLAQNQRVILFNVWEQTCEWAEGPTWTMTAQPRTGTLLVVRSDVDVPEVVFTTRHALGGAVEVTNEQVIDGGVGLSFTIDSPVGTEVTVWISAATIPDAVTSPADAIITNGPCDNVWAVTFTPATVSTQVDITF